MSRSKETWLEHTESCCFRSLEDWWQGSRAWEGTDLTLPSSTKAPHAYLHAGYAGGPILAVNAWRTLLRKKVQRRLMMGSPPWGQATLPVT